MPDEAVRLVEETVSSQEVFSGRLLRVRIDTVRLPNGSETTREIVEHPGAAAVVPLTDDGQVLLVRQWRHPIGEVSLELPAGTLDGSESPRACAERELCEEIGYFPGRLEKLGSMCVSPGYSDEIIHLFLASELQPASERSEPGSLGWEQDPDENLQTVAMPLAEAVGRCGEGQIRDSKTTTALLLSWQRLQGDT